MKFVLAAVLCALSVKTVLVMPVAEPGVQSDRLAVVPLEKSAPIQDTPHILRRETSETAAPEVSVHREGETPEEHAKHAHLATARLEDNAEKTETAKTEEPKSLPEEVKLVEAVTNLSEKKEEALLKNEEVVEDAIAAKAAAAEIITPAETLAPIPAVPVAPVPVENKVDAHITEGKNAPSKGISSELKEEVKSEEHSPKAVEKIEEPQQIAKSSISTKSEASAAVEPLAAVAAVAESEPSLKNEEKIESVVAESEQKAAEKPKEEGKVAEDKTDRVTRGTEETVPLDSAEAAPAAPLTSVSAAAPAPVAKVADALAEPIEKLADGIKEEKTELPEKKLDVVEPIGTSNNEEKPETAKSAESTLMVEASETVASVVAAVEKSEKVAEDGLSSAVKSAEQILGAKSASTELEAQPEAQPLAAAAAPAPAVPAPSEAKLEPVVDTIMAKTVSTEASKESSEAVKVEDSSSSEEKSSEEDHSDEKLEKSVETKSAGDLKKEESKVEELPKPQEVKEIKKDE